MRRVLPTETAKLAELQAPSRRLFVLSLRIIPVLALATLQRNNFSHDPISPFPVLLQSAAIHRLLHLGLRIPGQTIT